MAEPSTKMKLCRATTADAWRAWLDANSSREDHVWLVLARQRSGLPRVAYEDAIAEALCVGWIDSTSRTIDEQYFALRFSPRRDSGNWSAPNLRRLRELLRAGRMTPAGMAVVSPEALAAATADDAPERTTRELPLHPALAAALEASPRAREVFDRLAPSYRQSYDKFIRDAVRDETRSRRLELSVRKLEAGKKLSDK